MGTLRGDNGGGERPQEGGGLPDLPPEWGTIIIPDDPSELDDEGTLIRRQFRRAALRRRWRRRLHLAPEPIRRATDDSPGLAVPLLIMSIAVIATLVSLFAVAWPGRAPRSTPHVVPPSTASAISLAKLTVLDSTGAAVALRDFTPAVILLVEGCTCEALIISTVQALAAVEPPVSPTVTVEVSAGPRRTSILVVANHAPTLPSGLDNTVRVRAFADPNGSLRAAVPALAADRTSSAILVATDGTVIRAVRAVTAAADFDEDLSRLQ